MTERIYVQVDDRELDALTSKLDTSMKRMKKIDKDTFKLDARTKSIITRLPGLREADMLWREIQALSTATAGAEGAAGLVATGASVLLLMMAILTIMKQLDRIQKQIIRDMVSYEGLVREGMDVTHEEYLEMDKTVVGYATLWEDLMVDLEKAKSMGYLEGRWQSWEAISEYIAARVGKLIPSDWRPAHIPPGVPKPPTPQWALDIQNWWRDMTTQDGSDSGYDYYPNFEMPPDGE